MSTAATAPYLQTPMVVPSTGSGSVSSRRPAQRPTTYSGAGNYTTSPQAGSTASYQSPIPPPPRTSSNKHTTVSANSPTQPSSSGSGSAQRAASQSGSSRPHINERESSKTATRRDGDRRGTSAATGGATSSRTNGSVPVSTESTRESSRRREQTEDGNGAAPPPSIRQERLMNERERNGVATTPRKETKFGNYILGQTLGEGEFGKVKLGWRKDGGIQVAIKLMRRDTLTPHPNRLSKIYREIQILRTLSHPNIVKLFEMVETDRHIGIILEYASGGELFDYILTHRYLKDPPACRLFAQLISGVGYLHKMGIVHRDLKLENLLLDRNRNIIITDFGFANVFDPQDDISDYEDKLDNPAVLKELERGVGEDGRGRRGDLMATSCGSPCYAAPELVVSDGVYTGRKVDVWSCGVILYAMLAGYLPFDDDPANPEGDNINLLYKYIVSTPLTFPEYVTPHARDLLRRILVPDPRKRADLFEVARHSWLSPFANVVGTITSSTTSGQDIQTTTVTSDAQEQPILTRSASVREPSTTTHVQSSPNSNRHKNSPSSTATKTSSDAKRNTVQVEYAPPKTQTKRERQPTNEVDRTPTSKRADTSIAQPGAYGDTQAESSTPRSREPVAVSQPSTSSSSTAKPKVENLEKDIRVAPSKTSGVPRVQAVGTDAGKLPSPTTKHQQRATSYQGPEAQQAPIKIIPTALQPMEAPPLSQSISSQVRPALENRDQQPRSHSSSNPALPVPQVNTRPTTSETVNSNVSRSQSLRQPSYSKTTGASAAAQAANVQGKLQQPSQKKPYTISHPIPQDPDAITMSMSSYAPATNPRESNPDLQSKGHKRANTVGVPPASAKIFDRMLGSADKSQVMQQTGAALQSRPSVDRPSQGSVAPTPRQSMDQGRNGKFDKGKRRFSLIPSWAHKSSSHVDQVSTAKPIQGKLTKHERRPSRSAGHAGTELYNPAVPVSDAPQTGYTTDGSYVNLSTDQSGSSMHSLHQNQTEKQNTQLPPSSSAPNFAGVASGKSRKFADAYGHDGQISGGSGSTGAARRVMDFFRKRAIGRSK